uniref:Phenazine biosynthesis-like domain-containing protein 1 n=1 Tax=Phallusia mammillata TaxID=59560 RepID=A0A6F9DNB2_9ASCI|nr:phenazine biosynthesis-like domain-containing protein 1 [Phallusia mammillata]
MQKIAAEMNLSETAFVVSPNDDYSKDNSFGLRWFTPTNEVPLCGHATLASASTIFNVAKNPSSSITFSTLSGDLHAHRSEGYIVLDFPLNPPGELSEEEQTLADNLYEKILDLKKGDIQETVISRQTKKLLIRMQPSFTREDLEALKPTITAMLASHDGSIIKGVIVTVQPTQDSQYDFLSRYFAPWNGINEDPVTGSAHTVLAAYWKTQLGKTKMLGRQCSKRGGDVLVTVRDDGRVNIAGKTNVFLKGSICMPTPDC